MKIAIDIRSLQDKRHSGVQEYLLNLLEELLKIDQDNTYLLFSSGHRIFGHQDLLKIINQYPDIKIKHLKIANKFLTIFWRFFNWPNLDKFLEYPDIFFAPNLNILPKNILRKTVITFHDLSFRRFPEFFSLKSRLWHIFIRPAILARNAKSVIAVSDSTAEDTKEFYQINDEKIRTIPLGTRKDLAEIKDKDDEKLKEIKDKYNLPDKFILYLGTLEPRKNVTGIVRSYNLLRKNEAFKDYSLVLTGPKGWLFKKIFKEAAKSLYKKDIIFTGPILRQERICFYNLASLFVYPSFLEGFGLPPLEAMSCGLPVIVSNRSSLPSVVGKAGLLIDPYRTGDLAWAIELVLSDQKFYEILKKEGFLQAEKFNWQKTAQNTLKLFQDLK